MSDAAPTEKTAGQTGSPVGHGIKANDDSMLYHPAGSPYYDRTIAHAWFDSDAAAEAAGFTRWDDRERDAGAGRAAPHGVAASGRADAWADGAYGPGSADPAPDGSGPPGFDIKGNADSMLYHTTASVFYDITKAEVWFESEDAARAAGFRSFQD